MNSYDHKNTSDKLIRPRYCKGVLILIIFLVMIITINYLILLTLKYNCPIPTLIIICYVLADEQIHMPSDRHISLFTFPSESIRSCLSYMANLQTASSFFSIKYIRFFLPYIIDVLFTMLILLGRSIPNLQIIIGIPLLFICQFVVMKYDINMHNRITNTLCISICVWIFTVLMLYTTVKL